MYCKIWITFKSSAVGTYTYILAWKESNFGVHLSIAFQFFKSLWSMLAFDSRDFQLNLKTNDLRFSLHLVVQCQI